MNARLFAAAMLLLLASPVFAGFISDTPQLGKIELTDGKCTTSAVRDLIPLIQENPDDYKAGSVTYKGEVYQACWQQFPGGICLVVDRLGHVDAPIELFKETTSL